MALFRRSSPTPAGHPVTEFWTWWRETGRGIDPRQKSPMSDELSRRVAAIHPELTWHFGPGEIAQHRLVVSAGGVAEVRPTAERWLRAAPAEDSTWEYRASQQAEPDAGQQVLEIAGARLHLAETTFGIEIVEDQLRVHVAVFHPGFPELPEEARGQVTFLLLDWLLGEDDVERWLGHVAVVVEPPADAVGAVDLVAAVRGVASRRDPDRWALARWQEPDGALGLATYRVGLRWIDHPTLDLHHTVRLPYDTRPDGLPASAEVLEHLRLVEQELEAAAGSRGILVGHESARGHRTFHLYTDAEDQNVTQELKHWAVSRRARVESRTDPAWHDVRHLTG